MLAIVEPHCSGHRMQYVRWIAREALSQGYEVRLATLEYCLNHSLYQALQRECEGQVQVDILLGGEHLQSEKWLEVDRTTDLVRREFMYYRLFSAYYKSLPENKRPSFILVPYLEYCLHAVGLLGSPFARTPWGGIVMRTSFHFESVGVQAPSSQLHTIKKRLFFKALGNRHLQKLFTIDETLASYVNRNKSRLSAKLQYVADPAQLAGTQNRTQARQELGIPDEAVVLLVYGALSLRKGVDALLNAAQQSSFPERVQILLAGRQDKQVRSLLASSQARSLREQGRLYEHDRFLSDEEEHMVFRAADAVWLGYRDHYTMSGVLVQAGLVGLPVVACSAGLIGWSTRRYDLGLIVTVDDVGAVAKTIAQLTQAPEELEAFGRNGKLFSAPHKPEEFSQVIMTALRC